MPRFLPIHPEVSVAVYLRLPSPEAVFSAVGAVFTAPNTQPFLWLRPSDRRVAEYKQPSNRKVALGDVTAGVSTHGWGTAGVQESC